MEAERPIIDDMIAAGSIVSGQYRPSLDALRRRRSPRARQILADARALLDAIRNLYRKKPGASISGTEMSDASALERRQVQLAFPYVTDLYIASSWTPPVVDGVDLTLAPLERVLDVSLEDLEPETEPAVPAAGVTLQVSRVRLDGYRGFKEFGADLRSLTVLIGANGTGKSSLFDHFWFLSFAVGQPLPPQIDPASSGRMLFHADGPSAFSVSLDLTAAPLQLGLADDERAGDLLAADSVALRYELDIAGPIGRPLVTRERLATAAAGDAKSFAFIDLVGGRGKIRGAGPDRRLVPMSLAGNELALRLALHPLAGLPYYVRDFFAGLILYSGFDVGPHSRIRAPVEPEVDPVLRADGSNLAAVLFWLLAKHNDVWQELEFHAKRMIPGLASLGVGPAGGSGIMVTWREEGLANELTLAELSDGSLRALCWLAACLPPLGPTLMLVDEPETGLHPRALPILAGALKAASGRSQVLVATHSPELLKEFDLEDVAVMRKVDGRVEFVRAADSDELRKLVAAIGGNAIAELFVSEELETLA